MEMDITLKSWSALPGFPSPEFRNDRQLGNVLRRLKMGNLMQNFSIRKSRSEPCTLQVNLDTRCVLWSHHNTEGSINIGEIKEIRKGKSCRDFEKHLEGSSSLDDNLCFSILYGQEFTLKIISLAGE